MSMAIEWVASLRLTCDQVFEELIGFKDGVSQAILNGQDVYVDTKGQVVFG